MRPVFDDTIWDKMAETVTLACHPTNDGVRPLLEKTALPKLLEVIAYFKHEPIATTPEQRAINARKRRELAESLGYGAGTLGDPAADVQASKAKVFDFDRYLQGERDEDMPEGPENDF